MHIYVATHLFCIRMMSLHEWPRVCDKLLLRVVCMLCPRLGAMRTASGRSTKSLRRFSSRGHGPRWKLFVSRSVLDTLKTGRISNRRCWRRRSFVSYCCYTVAINNRSKVQTRLIMQIGIYRTCFDVYFFSFS